MNIHEAIAQDIPIVCRLLSKKPKAQIHSLNDLQNNTYFEVQTIEGETIDISDIKEWANSWPLHKTYTYKFLNYSADEKIANKKTQDKILAVVFRQFQLTIRYIKFRRERDESKETDFRFEWSSKLSTFGNNANVLAQAFLPTSNPVRTGWSGLIQINDLWEWGIYGKDGAQFLIQVLIHELFHSLGFVHDEKDNKSTLFPYANGAIFFTARDKLRLWTDYGRRMLPAWLVKVMVKRLVNGFDFD